MRPIFKHCVQPIGKCSRTNYAPIPLLWLIQQTRSQPIWPNMLDSGHTLRVTRICCNSLYVYLPNNLDLFLKCFPFTCYVMLYLVRKAGASCQEQTTTTTTTTTTTSTTTTTITITKTTLPSTTSTSILIETTTSSEPEQEPVDNRKY